ncbi:unnamed protein product [Eretmochelys imbricata]
MRVQMLAVLLLFVSLLCAEGIRGASLARGSESQHSQKGLGESKVMVKREARRLRISFVTSAITAVLGMVALGSAAPHDPFCLSPCGRRDPPQPCL